MASNLASLPADRTTQEQWRGTDVSVGQVLAQLSILRARSAHLEALDQGNPHPRNSVMDLVVVASDPESAEDAATTIEILAAHHPCRAIIVLDEPGGGESRIDAAVTSYSHRLLQGVQCQYEQVFLRARGAAAEHIPSLVEALLISDVTTYLWWTGSPPFRERRFQDALQVADVVLVDSSLFERPYQGFQDLAQLAVRIPPYTVADFHWARLRPWREILAQFFNPPDRRGFLYGIGGLGIDYVATGRGNRSAAVLMAGWLAGALGWRLKHAVGGAGGIVVAHFTSPGAHQVEVAMRPVELSGFASGEVTGVRVEAVWQGRTCTMAAVRDRESLDHVVSDGSLGGIDIPRRNLPMPSLDNASLINQLLTTARGDVVFKRSLKAGAELKAALR